MHFSTKFEFPKPTCSWVISRNVLYFMGTIDIAFSFTAHVRYHVTYAQGVNFTHIFGIPNPTCLFTMQLWWLYNEGKSSCVKTMHGPELIAPWVSAHTWNHVICWRCSKCRIAVILIDVNLPYCTSKVEHIVAFTATAIFVLRMRKKLFMNFRGQFRHHRSNPHFLTESEISQVGDVFPCILYAES